MTLDNTTTGRTTGVTTVSVSPGERIRWGAIVAGLFAALSTLIVLTILGIAVGLSAYDPGDSERAFSIGGGIWGAISMIIAFIVGGYVASRWARPHLRDSSPLLHGAMVWAVAIPLFIYMLGSLGTMLGSAAVSNNRDGGLSRNTQFDGAQPAGAQLGEQVGRATGETDAEEVKRGATGAAWGTLISLLLGLGAAALGGYLGAHNRDNDFNRGDRTRTTVNT